MKTDVILINSTGEGMDAALAETEKAAAYRGLNAKEVLGLCLLSEELMGMLRTIVGEKDARYWIEAEGKVFSLHLAMKTRMNADLREELLDATTTGRNEAAKGFIGLLRDKLETAMMAEEDCVCYDAGGAMLDEAPEDNEWDRYERSILRRLADEIKIAVRGGKVEMDVLKAF